MGIDEVSATWTRLGQDDPLWAVLTDREKAGGGWSEREFLTTGEREIATLLRRLAELGVPPTTGRALDFGCGAGRLTHGLVTAGFDHVVGMDISAPMRQKARTLVPSQRAEFRAVPGSDLSAVEDASVDLVYTCRVLQHMPPELAEGYIAEFYRVARPGAIVVFQVPARPARSVQGLILRALPVGIATRLRRGMEMHGIPALRVRSLVAEHGADLVAVEEDDSAGPRWESHLYVTRAGTARAEADSTR